MYNTENPSIHFVVEGGALIEIKTPGSYAFLPINVEKLIKSTEVEAGSHKQQIAIPRQLLHQDKHQDNNIKEESIVEDTEDEVYNKRSKIDTLQDNSIIEPLFTNKLFSLIQESRNKI